MFKLSSGVGYQQKNNPADVAFVQMALKLAKKGHFRNTQTPYWKGRIDGSYSYHLASAIARYKEDHFSDKELRMPNLLKESIEAIHSSSSRSYTQLIRSLPSSHKNAAYGVAKIRNRIVLYQLNTNKSGKANYRVEDLSLPNDLAGALLRYLDQIFQGYSVIPTIEKITADHDGRFNVRIGIKGGHLIDADTGKTVPISDQTKSYAVNLFQEVVNSPVKRSERLWRFTGQREIIFTSKRQYSFLKPSNGAKAWLLWQLGSHKTRHQSQVVERALDAYDRHRLGARLTPENEQFMIEIFGDDWAQVKNKQQIKERKAFEFRKKIESTQNTIRLRKGRLLFLENKLRENLGLERVDVLGNLARDLLLEKINGGRKKHKTNQSSNNSRTENEKKADETILEAIDNFTGLSISTIFDPPEDVTDVIIFGLGVAAFAFLALGAGLLLAGAGTASTVVIGVARFAFRAGEFIEGAVDAYEAVSDILRNRKLDAELAYLQSEIGPAQNALTDAIEDLHVFIAAVKSEGIVTLADFGFSKQELDHGMKQLQSLKLV